MSPPAPLESRDDVSLDQDDPPFRWQRRVGLIPRSGGLGIGRRALFWAALAWLPVAVWAWWAGRVLPEQGQTTEPLLQQSGAVSRAGRPVPLGKTAILAVALPVLIPFIGVLALQIPIKELLQGLMKGLL